MGDSVSSRKSKIFAKCFIMCVHDIISGANEGTERTGREGEREKVRRRGKQAKRSKGRYPMIPAVSEMTIKSGVTLYN